MRFLFFAIACAPLLAQPADLVLRNGKIVTMNPAAPLAQALAVRGDRIERIGSETDANGWIGPKTRVIDLAGQTAVPGLIEGHAHFLGVGEFRLGLDLRAARSWEEIVAQVGRAARQAKPGEWIVGRGWHQSKWDRAPEPNVEGFPLHAALSAAAPANPVMLSHASGHATFLNAAAMKAAGITRSTASPSGGEIHKDSRGEPTGLLRETAQRLGDRAYGSWQARRPLAERRAEFKRLVRLASEDALSKGITSFYDAGSSLATVDALRRMARAGELPLRLWVMLGATNRELEGKLDQYRIIGEGNNFLTVRAIKRYMDGALGSRGAWLLEPYADKPESTGLNTEDPAEIRKTAELAMQHGFQLCVHAIGDRANRETLDIYEQAFRAHADKKDPRWRIEHAQHLNPLDIPRFGALGVIAAMQAVHCTSDAPYVVARLGARRAGEGAYVWRSLLDSGAVVANGTDAPVEDVNPFASLYAAITRRPAGAAPFYPAQRMTREEALRSYTLSNAYAGFEEKLKGSLEVGKLADITVLTRDLLTVPEEEIPAIQAAYTIVGGRVAYRNGGGGQGRAAVGPGAR
jgi:predicted amidohydrolase YtcJ